MVTPIDILDALKERIESLFPGESVYTDLVPNNFTRPCSQVILGDYKAEVAFGCSTVELRPTYALTTFVSTDAFHQCDQRVLNQRQMILLGMLLPGYIRVKDRAPKVVHIKMTGDFDSNSVVVTFAYTLSREDFMNLPQLPEMGELQIRQEVQTYG